MVASASGTADSIEAGLNPERPIWRLPIAAEFLPGTDRSTSPADSIVPRVHRQFDQANAIYREGDFDGYVLWDLIGVFPVGRTSDRPEGEFRVLYDPRGEGPSAWSTPDLTAVITSPSTGGVLGPTGTITLAHELGHARGAVDLYRQKVELPELNPVSGRTFFPPHGIMTDLMGGWEPHSRWIINMNADSPGEGGTPGADQFPDQLVIRVFDRRGVPAPGAIIGVHPVVAPLGRVDSTPRLTGKTDVSGTFTTTGAVMKDGWPNLHVVAVLTSGDSALGWLPMAQTQLFYFEHPSEPYVLTLTEGRLVGWGLQASQGLAAGPVHDARGATITDRERRRARGGPRVAGPRHNPPARIVLQRGSACARGSPGGPAGVWMEPVTAVEPDP